MDNKLKYSAPELIDLSLKSVKGDCTGGSGDVALCQSGLQAQNDCTSNGGNASLSCTDGGNNSAGCDPFGSTP